jgi:hypothetical protein
MVKASLVAPLAKFVPKTGICEWPSEFVHKERHLTARRGINDLLQHRQDLQREPLQLSVTAFELCERELAVSDVLTTEARDVRPPLPGERQEGQGKPRLAPNRVTFLELANLINSPSVIAGRVVALE